MDANLSSVILDNVDAGQAAAISLLEELVRRDSVTGNEASAQDLMAEVFTNLGLQVERIGVQDDLARHEGWSNPLASYDGRQSIVGLYRQSGPQQGRSLIFNGHIDVVPAGPLDLWATPPFEPVIRDGRMYGRGVGDMKAGIVAYCAAFQALRQAGLAPAAPVTMQTVIEEECTGNGALSCVAQGYTADAAIIPEPFDHTIMTAQVGVLWCEIEVRGRPAHVLNTAGGLNAIAAAFRIYGHLERLEAEWNEPAQRHPAYIGHPHPFNFNLGEMHGGEWISSVPAHCKMGVRIGFPPGPTAKEIEDLIRGFIREACAQDSLLAGLATTVTFTGLNAAGYALAEESPFMQQLDAAHGMVRGEPAKRLAATCTTDARFFHLYGDVPVTCYGPEATNIHGIDESVSLASLRDTTAVLALFMASWCGLQTAAAKTTPLFRAAASDPAAFQ